MQTRGAIYHHKDMKFYNGGVANKYLILLNTPDKADPYLFVKTTAQKKSRPSNPGCIKKHKCFFIKAGTAVFPKDTWVLLHEIYEIHPNKIDTNSDIDRALHTHLFLLMLPNGLELICGGYLLDCICDEFGMMI